MAIQMIPNSRLGQEAVILKADAGSKEGKPDKAGDAVEIRDGRAKEVVKRDGLTMAENAGETGKTVQVGQVSRAAAADQMTESGKDGMTESSTVRNRSLDQYIPGEKAEGQDGQSSKVQSLKLKKKQLKEQIKAETDPRKAGELKRKLDKVEKELKWKGGLTF